MTNRAYIIRGNALALPLPDNSVDLTICSPPYFGLRSYTDNGAHYQGQLGSEATPAEFIDALVAATREMMRVTKPSGSIFVNLGDKYAVAPQRWNKQHETRDWSQSNPARRPKEGDDPEPFRIVTRESLGGVRAKSLMLLPERYRIACVDQLGLIARAVIIWNKPNGLPESVTDRVRRSHEDWVHLTKSPRYFSAVDEVREEHAPKTLTHRGGGQAYGNDRNPDNNWGNPNGKARVPDPLGKLPGSVWTIATQPLTVPPHLGVDHFAAYPMEWPRRIIAGWSPTGICTVCGEGRRPVSDVSYTRTQYNYTSRSEHNFNNNRSDVGLPFGSGALKNVTITGYACACPDGTAPTRPSTILDPFGGTGTTALVADVMGRTGISVDMSADYCRLAEWRINDPGQRAAAAQVEKVDPVPDGQLSLFGD